MSDSAISANGWRRSGEAFVAFLPITYILSVVPIIVFLSFFRQPIGVADEWSHIARAAQLADGHFFTEFAETGKPPLGSIDPTFETLTNQVHARRHESMATLLPSLQMLEWSGERKLANYNSSVYFPAPYLLTAFTIKIARLIDAGIVRTLQIINLLNGLLCAILAASAIAVAPRGKAIIFLIAILPMSLFLFASASPDGPLISSALLAFALLSRCLVRHESSIYSIGVTTCLATVIVATKLPYLPLFVLVVLAMWFGSSSSNRPPQAVLVAAVVAIIVVPIGWSVITKAGSVDVTWGAGVGNPSGQVSFLLHHPGAVILLAWRTLAAGGWNYLYQMVGYLGWQDAPISVTAAYLLIAAIALASVLDGPSDRFSRLQLLILFGLLGSFGAVFLGLYVAANPVGSLNPIDGVQGRYFLPLLAFVAALIPPLANNRWSKALLALVIVASIPVAGFETMRIVIERYYV